MGRRLRSVALAMLPAALAACGGDGGDHPRPASVAASAGRAPVIVVAGDIAGPGPDDEATAAIVERMRPARVLTTGDNAYPSGRLSDFRRYYAPSWGRFKAITRPAPGNHEYMSPGAAGYFRYFGRAAGRRARGYYSFDLGAWHLVALNSEIGVGPGSAQLRWLRRDLAAARGRCTLAYWHRPRFSSGRYGDATDLAAMWRVLQRGGVDVALTGHDHGYQRYRPIGGIRQWVVGTGGRSHYPLRPDRRRAVGNDRAFGVLRLTLRRRSFDYTFVPAAAPGFRDAGRGVRCR